MRSHSYLTVLAAAISVSCSTALPDEQRASQNDTNTYDYVIVGGGVTGLVVANRLTEDPMKTVLVIEAGQAYDNPNIRLPYAATYALNGTLFWKNYTSEPETQLGDKTWNVWVAEVLGGGSIVNGMVYDRGSAADYNAWEELGNKGWGWEGLYPFFKKGVEFIPPPAKTIKDFGITWDPRAYGKGPLKIGISDFQFPDLKAFFAAYRGAGANMPLDGNNGEAYGASWFPNTMNPKTGERSHARNSFYDPISQRTNLKVLLQTEATELVFKNGKKGLVASGVKITDRTTGETKTIYARKEVVLAAGAINTPKLLQISGVGPKSVLEAAGIPVKLAHEGVGANFQDHPYTFIAFNSTTTTVPNPTSWSDPTFNASAWAQYRANKTGPLTQARGNSLAFIQLPQVAPKQYLNLSNQVLTQQNSAHLPSLYNASPKLLAGVAAQRAILSKLYKSNEAAIVEYPVPASGGFVLVAHQKPLSRGQITLNPTNPHGPPKVLFNALTNPLDKAVLAASVRYIRTVWARPELSAFKLVETSPGAQYVGDDELIAKMVSSGSIWPTLSHPSGSCAMMPEKLGGCVSDELLFYGIEKLSVVDASVLPLIPGQHIQSTMYAVGEKAADIIKRRG
ncbi:hypothetical protein FB567DRAFT_581397 [Paraphoma chrysanthemicola]|uniref:Glucose-methanol-choline oxidoreductase N-terminal domain-containing protein n=1 Tax=Paraphoma chrysanthemicola TaxID=798071 RepID=A0A8K0R373_9PLEO|nr:hypothetical protein FB567DRAFT_581397 [Paraphoma chrysanthemicola]